VTFLAHPELERLGRTLLLFDAAGLGLFCVAGTVKAVAHGLGPVAAAVLGVTTAVGGGVLRDVIARETPALVRPDSELYALPAFVGALGVAVVASAGAFTPLRGAVFAGAIVVVRVLALHRHWRGPRVRRRSEQARDG
jgi:uncharacterized membrane protein YeiH